MDLSNPLVTVAPTLDAGVLQVLAATTGWCTAGEVHRRLGRGSDEGVRNVLSRLVRQGVVLTESPGRFPLYLLNRDHVCAPQIEAMAMARAEIVDRIRFEIEGWGVAPTHAGLFGSFARGTADADSDIDLLVVRPEPGGAEAEWLDQIDRLTSKVPRWTGNRAQVLDVEAATLGRMARQNDPLVDSWRADEVHLCGERLFDLLRRVR